MDDPWETHDGPIGDPWATILNLVDKPTGDPWVRYVFQGDTYARLTGYPWATHGRPMGDPQATRAQPIRYPTGSNSRATNSIPVGY